MNPELPKWCPRNKWGAYVLWLGVMSFFASLPAVARWVDDTSLQIDKLTIAGADAFGLFGVIMAGAHFGACYGVHGTAWKWRRLGVVVPALTIFVIILASAVALNVTGDLLCGEVAGSAVAAIRNVAVGVAGIVLGANIGWWRGGNNTLPWKRIIKECALLSLIFVGSLAVVYAQSAGDEPCDGGDVILSHTAPLTGLAVAGAALGAHYASYKNRYEGSTWFSQVTAAVLGLLIASNFLIGLYVLPQDRGVVWMITIPFLSVLIGMIGVMLGMRIFACMQK